MVKDKTNRISNYFSLDDRLRRLAVYRGVQIDRYEEFKVDPDYTEVFTVEEGECSFATSWRENRENREVTAVTKAGKDDFVLFLPGEPIAATPAEGSVVIRRKLK